MKKLYIFIALFLTSGIAFAQSDADVLRFSRTLPLGTARSAVERSELWEAIYRL